MVRTQPCLSASLSMLLQAQPRPPLSSAAWPFLSCLSQALGLSYSLSINLPNRITMAEAVGLIASVATLTEVALKLKKLVVRLRDAPEELLALFNEVTDLRFLFTEIEKAAIERPDSQARLSKMLKFADERLDSLNLFLQKIDKVDVKLVDRLVWLRYRSSVVKLQSELHEVRSQLTGLLQVDALSVRTKYSLRTILIPL